MYGQVTAEAEVSVLLGAICKTRAQLDAIVQAFLQRQFLFRHSEALGGTVVNVTGSCVSGCGHARYQWLLPRDTLFVRMPVQMHAQVLRLRPGERLGGTVKSISGEGLTFETPSGVSLFVA